MLKNSRHYPNKYFLITIIAAILLTSASVGAMEQYPYFDPQKGYGIENDALPWFDGKDYPFFREMYDGKSIKPQEEGSYQKFPEKSVPVRLVLGKVVKIFDPFVPAVFGDGAGTRGNPREFTPKNPTQASADSLARGKTLYNTYCAACHGEDGQSQTVVVEKGVPAPPITAFFKMSTAAPHLYNKIKYGSFFQEPRGFMPSYGAQTSVRDRWDMVNYMMSDTFGKGSSQ
ncbi:MAG: cytochrome c [SAR324 cluster bacterium]|nr:cytochrome c [SAR324 cluster bacterium]MBL7034694.1 cytochrome c [SAR324 cluster bacterium]